MAIDPVLLAKVRDIAASGAARQIRQAARLSLADVAVPCGVDQSTIYRWERGLRLPHGEAAIRYGGLLEALSRSADVSKAAS